ncbi:nuclear protein [Pseudohyphozyma bogoriensis]|nr:nuclear protein [Pseudohyphozyma bogoriensis]
MQLPVEPSLLDLVPSPPPIASTSTLPPPTALNPPPRPAPLPRGAPTFGARPSTEALEKQPQNASGYEWNERYQTGSQAKDGTASLSLDPDGEGYLGFASGATLLRIVQLCAGAVFIPPFSFDEIPTPLPPTWQPSSDDLDAYIDAYFRTYHPQYPLVHEPTFRAQWNEIVPQPISYQWDLLVNCILGIGAFCSFQPIYVIDYFLERAISGIRVEHLEAGSLTLVQSFTLLSNLTQKRNKPNSGSVYLESEADVNMVHNVSDRAFTPSTPSVPPASTEPTMYTSIMYQSSFHRVSNACYNAVISTSPVQSVHQTLALDAELQRWHSTLPDWMRHDSETYPGLRFSKQKLFWRYENLRIILHRRAFLERAMKGLALWMGLTDVSAEDLGVSTELDLYCSEVCLQSASATISTIHHFCATRPSSRLECWYALHFLFHASFVPLIALHTDLSSPRRTTWQADVDRARSTLHTLRDDPLAERCLQIIDLLLPTTLYPSTHQPSTSAPPLDHSVLAQLLQNTSTWAGTDPSFAPSWLPFADFTSLSEFWPKS